MSRWFNKHRHGFEKACDVILFVMALGGFTISVINTVIKYNTGEASTPSLVVFYAMMAMAFISFVAGMLLHRYNRKRDRIKLYVHNFAAQLLDNVEDMLEAKKITIPDDAREGDETEARLYGYTYDDLLYKTEISVAALLGMCEDGNFEVITDFFEGCEPT